MEFYEIFLKELMFDAVFVSFIYSIRLRGLLTGFNVFLLALFIVMTPFYKAQFNIPVWLEVPVVAGVSILGFYLLFKLASIKGLELSMSVKGKKSECSSIKSLIRNTDTFIAICAAPLITFLAAAMLSTTIELGEKLLLIGAVAITFAVFAVKYVFNRYGSVEHQFENALWALFTFSFVFSIMLFATLFLGVYLIQGNYALASTVAAIEFILPVTISSYHIIMVSRRTLTNSPSSYQNHRM